MNPRTRPDRSLRRRTPVFAAVLAAVALLAPARAPAFTQMYRFQYCAGLPSARERLACYDNYARELGLDLPHTLSGLSGAQEKHGAWTVRTETLGPRQSPAVFVFTEGQGAFFGVEGRLAVPTLVARCREGVTQLYVAFSPGFPVQPGPLDHSVLYYDPIKANSNPAAMPGAGPDSEKIPAKLRLGNATSLDITVRRSETGWGFFFPNPVSYLNQMRRHDRLEFTYTPKEHASVDVRFSLEGLGEGLGHLREACSW